MGIHILSAPWEYSHLFYRCSQTEELGSFEEVINSTKGSSGGVMFHFSSWTEYI